MKSGARWQARRDERQLRGPRNSARSARHGSGGRSSAWKLTPGSVPPGSSGPSAAEKLMTGATSISSWWSPATRQSTRPTQRSYPDRSKSSGASTPVTMCPRSAGAAGVRYVIDGLPLHVDWYICPHSMGAWAADAKVIFDQHGLPRLNGTFPGHQDKREVQPPTPKAANAHRLLQVSLIPVAAKYVVRRSAGTGPMVSSPADRTYPRPHRQSTWRPFGGCLSSTATMPQSRCWPPPAATSTLSNLCCKPAHKKGRRCLRRHYSSLIIRLLPPQDSGSSSPAEPQFPVAGGLPKGPDVVSASTAAPAVPPAARPSLVREQFLLPQ
jgi:hypothetical protein